MTSGRLTAGGGLLVVSSFSPMLRGWEGRTSGDKRDHDQADIGVSVRMIGNWLGPKLQAGCQAWERERRKLLVVS